MTVDLGPTVAEHVGWLRLRGLSEKTIKHRLQVLALLARFLAPTPLLSATRADLNRWQLAMLNSPLTANSRRSYVEQLQGFYKWAAAERLTAEDPSLALITPKLPRGRPHPIAEPDLDAALRLVPAFVRPWLVLAAYCGLRCGEIAALAREDVDEQSMLLTVRGKGGKTRRVPMAPLVLATLVDYGLPAESRRGAAAGVRQGGMPASGPLFVRADGSQATAAWLSQTANKFLHRAGVRESLHALRHRFATEFYRDTKDLRATQELLGHENPATTAIYTAPDEAATLAAVVSLSERLGRPAAPPLEAQRKAGELLREMPPGEERAGRGRPKTPTPQGIPLPPRLREVVGTRTNKEAESRAANWQAVAAGRDAALDTVADLLDSAIGGGEGHEAFCDTLLGSLDRAELVTVAKALLYRADAYLGLWVAGRVDAEGLDDDAFDDLMAREVALIRHSAGLRLPESNPPTN